MFGGKSGSMPSVMGHSFSQVPKVQIPRSSFDRSHGLKTTFNAGILIPIFLDEVLPGDTMSLRTSIFARLATPIAPVMDNLYADTHYFFVPYRLIWDNFKKMMGEVVNPGDSTSYLVPIMTCPAGGYATGTLQDYLGLPTAGPGAQKGVPAGATYSHSALPTRAFNLIWNEWFRDQNLQNSIVVDKGDGPDDPANYGLQRRGKRHDYFTSCLPWPQKGTAVTIPLGTSAPVLGIGKFDQTFSAVAQQAYDSSGNRPTYAHKQSIDPAANASTWFVEAQTIGGTEYPNIRADLSSATAATINALRQAFQLQRLYERDARGGTRYTEIIRSHFGVVSPDARLQRPEYLGGGTSPITISPIPQTSATGATPQGNLAAMGTMHATGHGFTKSFTEHGVLIGLISVRADLNYQQGLDRMWSRRAKYDFYWPALAHIGEQAVLNKEIFLDGSANDSAVFGYQEAFAEYRYKPSKITGQFRSTYATPLDVWHLAQKFTALPALNSTFIQDNPPIDRVIAVAGQHFLCDVYHKYICARPMPTYSVPGMIDHF